MRIGIITNGTNLFSNGLAQNSYYLYEVFRQAGHSCKLLSYNETFKKLQGLDVPVTYIGQDFNFSDVDLLICVAQGVTQETYLKCKASNTIVVGFTCGNVLAHHLDDLTSKDSTTNVNRIVRKGNPIDIIWVLGSFYYQKRYLELMRDAPVFPVPHLWSPCILKQHARESFKIKEEHLYFDGSRHTNGKINILIVEPNLMYAKTCLIPLMIAEDFHIKHPDLIDTVFIFSFPTANDIAKVTVENLTVNKKVRRFSGMHMADILQYFNQQASLPVLISHQIDHGWNYVYYEMLHFGLPWVHNSEWFKDFGYYYSQLDIEAGTEAVLRAKATHAKSYKELQTKHADLLRTIDPYDTETVKTWDMLLRKTVQLITQ